MELSKSELSKWRITAITEEDDILTYEDDGHPACISAKTSCEEVNQPG